LNECVCDDDPDDGPEPEPAAAGRHGVTLAVSASLITSARIPRNI
jgi:hypothetical protein